MSTPKLPLDVMRLMMQGARGITPRAINVGRHSPDPDKYFPTALNGAYGNPIPGLSGMYPLGDRLVPRIAAGAPTPLHFHERLTRDPDFAAAVQALPSRDPLKELYCPGCSKDPTMDHVCHRGVLGTFARLMNSTDPKAQSLASIYPRSNDRDDALRRVAERAALPNSSREILRQYPPNPATQQAAIELFRKLGAIP